MRPQGKLAALLAASLLLPQVASAARREKKPKAAAAAASPKVVIKTKTSLRADPSDIGKAVGKVKPKDKVTFLEYSPDKAWVKVQKGKVAGWIGTADVDGLPPDQPAVAQLPEPPKPEPVKPEPPKPEPVKPEPPKPEPVAQVEPPKDPEAFRDPAKPKETPVQAEPAKPAESPSKPVVVAPAPKTPLAGLWFSLGGGAGFLGTKFDSSFKSGLDPELFKYEIDFLPSVAVQAKLGYTFGYKWLRVGVDGGYRFAGGTSLVVKLAEKDGLQNPNNPSAPTPVLPYQRQTIGLTSHDADGAASIGAYFALGSKLEMSIRARGGIQLQAFLPDFNGSAVLPKELFYGPLVGGVIELQSRFVPGFGLRLDGAYIPVGVRQQNTNARDAICPATAPEGSACRENPESSSGFSVGGTVSVRVISGFDVELGYRLLSTQTSYAAGSISERLAFDRDPIIRSRAATETLLSAERATSQHTAFLGISFRR